MILPFFGAISDVISVHSRKLFGYKAVAYSSLAISFLVYCLGAPYVHQWHPGWLCFHDHHHGHLRTDGIKIFSWLATLWGGKLRLESPLLFATVGMFVIGGITGVWWRRCL